MDCSISSQDFDLVLDKQNVIVPAVVKEALLTTHAEYPMDFATYRGDFCWIVTRSEIWVWDYKVEGGKEALNSRRVGKLPIPFSGLKYSANLVQVFEKDKGRRSAIAVSREGDVRYWPEYRQFGKEPAKYVDTRLNMPHEISINLHLLDVGSDETDTIFILVTAAGTIFAVHVQPDGHAYAEQLSIRETLGISNRLSHMFFGTGKNLVNRVSTSLLYCREGEEVEDFDTLTQDALILSFGTATISAFDLSNKSQAWSISTKALLGPYAADHFEKQEDINKPDALVTILDARLFKGGVLAIAAAYHSMSEYVTFFLTHLSNFDYECPKVQYFQEIPNNGELREFCSPMMNDTFLHHFKLVIPRETATASQLQKTDGILVIHPRYVQSVFLPDDLSKNEKIPHTKTLVISENEKIIGVGEDSVHCYVMTSNAKTAAIRLMPQGFESTQSDDMNVLEIISSVPKPEGSPEGEDLYNMFVEFCDKDFNRTSQFGHALANLSEEEKLKLSVNYIWSVFDEMNIDVELREKKKLLDYFVLYLRHLGILPSHRSVPSCAIENTRIGVKMSGPDFFFELYERLQVLEGIYKWKALNENHRDLLRHVGVQIAKDLKLKQDGQIAAYQFSYLHALPLAAVNLCEDLLPKPAFNEVSIRNEMLCYTSELLLEFARQVQMARRTQINILAMRGVTPWTQKLATAYSDMCLLLINEITTDIYNVNESLKFAQYITKLLSFHFSETTERPDGHPVLMQLYTIGEERLALELADMYKDFKLICKLCLEHYDYEALEVYKKRFASDNFEGYYLAYLNRKQLYAELLEQTGEQAEKYVATLDHIRWRREIQRDQFAAAGKTLLMESEKDGNTLYQQKVFTSLAKLSYLCCNDVNAHMNEIEDINVTHEMIEYQESLPLDFFRKYYPDNRDHLLSAAELLELCKLRVEEPDCTRSDYFKALALVANMLKVSPEKDDYHQARQLIWEAVIRADDWSQIEEADFRNTVFTHVFNDVLEANMEDLPYYLPNCDLLLQNTKEDRKKCASSHRYIRYCIEETQKDLMEA